MVRSFRAGRVDRTASLAAKRKYLAERNKSEGKESGDKRHDNDLAQIPFRGPMTLLGEIIEDTATRYYYRPHVGDELTFVEKNRRQSTSRRARRARTGPPAKPNAAAPLGLAMTLTLVVVGLVLAPPTGRLARRLNQDE